LNLLLSRLKLPKLHNTGCMVSEIFESLFWIGPGFIPKEQSYSMMKNWLDKCNELEDLDFNAKAKIREGLKGLNADNKKLYEEIMTTI
jgi:hypothetical protein